jgi:outer membrane lipoprotein SlyB
VSTIRRHSALLSAALLLSACASDATFMNQNGAMPEPQRLEADASDCRSIWPLVGGFFVGAAYGAAEGALVGAASGGADIGAIIGAGAGGVIGLTVGAIASAGGDGYERCMTGRGYVRMATATAPEAPEPAAAVETASSVTPQATLGDPAR